MSVPHEKRVVIYSLLLVAATLAFYNPITHNRFIDFDDSSYILKNPQVQRGLTWDTVKWSFTTFHEGNWHPLTWLSHAVDCQLFGLNPLGHHYTNLLLHAVNAVLLFLLLRQATGLAWPSLVVGALFALHPVNVESVAWAAERKNVLSMLFFLLALHAYGRYARTGRRYLYGLVAVLFALGLMAKSQVVTLPFIGLFVAVVWTLNAWTLNAWTLNAWILNARTLPGAVASESRISSLWRAAPALLVVFSLGCLTYRQLGYWRDDETLWRYTLSVTQRNYVAHDNLAIALAKLGRSDEAVSQFQAASALHKYPANQVLTLALYELRVGHPQEVIEECDSVLRAAAAPKVQAVAWSELGQADLQLRHYDQAADSYQNALRLNPEDEMALIGSGLLALRQEQPDAAVRQLAHAVKIDPSDVNLLLYAQALRRAGRPAEAGFASAEARKISPDLSQAQIAAGQFLSVAGRP